MKTEIEIKAKINELEIDMKENRIRAHRAIQNGRLISDSTENAWERLNSRVSELKWVLDIKGTRIYLSVKGLIAPPPKFRLSDVRTLFGERIGSNPLALIEGVKSHVTRRSVAVEASEAYGF